MNYVGANLVGNIDMLIQFSLWILNEITYHRYSINIWKHQYSPKNFNVGSSTNVYNIKNLF